MVAIIKTNLMQMKKKDGEISKAILCVLSQKSF
jgi:hypothetical protein